MKRITTYRVTAERDEKFWLLRVPHLPGVFGQVRRLEQAPDAIREVIALMLEVEPDSFDIEVVPALDERANALVISTLTMRRAADRLVNGSNTRLASTVHYLSERMTMRDVAELLDLSFQRVAQVAAEPVPPEDPHLAELEAASARIMAEIEKERREQLIASGG